MGGHEGPAKHTKPKPRLPLAKMWSAPNKALLAIHVKPWPRRPEATGRVTPLEAAVAGRHFPVVKSLIRGLAGNEITRVPGRDERQLQLYPDPAWEDARSGPTPSL